MADLEAAVEAHGTATWVLAGGGTPAAAYRRLAAHDLRAGVEWDRVRVAMGDERCVPVTHPDSNWGQAAAALLDHVPVPGHQLLRPPGELGAEAAADAYQAALAALPAGAAGAGQRLEVVWLGVGEDGHCLSLFPGRPEVEVADRLVVAVHDSPKPPPDRVSLTLAALAGTERLLVLAAGPGKAEPVARARAGDDRLPVTRAVQAVRPPAGRSPGCSDRAAAAGAGQGSLLNVQVRAAEGDPMTGEQGQSTLSVTDNRTGRTYEIPIKDGAIPAMALRDIKVDEDDFGLLSYDPAFMNTASCRSAITFIDGEQGILRYRGYPIQELAERVSFLEVAWLLVSGDLPDPAQLADWTDQINHHTFVKENIKKFIDGFHHDAHPMGILVGTVGALSTFYPDAKKIDDPAVRRRQVVRLIAKIPTLAAYAYRHSQGHPYPYPRQRAVVRRQLPQPHVEDGGAQVPSRPGAGARPGRAVHPARRPRAELLDQRHAGRRQLQGRPLLGGRGRRGRPVRAACTAGPTSRCCGCSTRSARSTRSRPTSSGSSRAR